MSEVLGFGARIVRFLRALDWLLIGAVSMLMLAGLITMNSFGEQNPFFDRQLIWVFFGLASMILASLIDFRFLRRTPVVMVLFLFSIGLLVATYILGDPIKGSVRWIDIGIFSLQPSDPIKLTLIIILAKYFSRRHIEIAHFKHILISGFYAFIFFALVFFQPDLGSSIIIFLLWLGMVSVSGLSKKHLFALLSVVVMVFVVLWLYVFAPYQKDRIISFLHPLEDIQGAGYNAYQSMVAVGSGEVFGKGIGYGTQSKLQFLPEFETDFIFASFAEEWGFLGVVILFALFAVVFWRIVDNALAGASNFETLFGAGLAVLFLAHFLIHVGMNIGLLPITGTTLPFMSYGGSHLLTESIGVGILMGMRRYSRPASVRTSHEQELIGVGS